MGNFPSTDAGKLDAALFAAESGGGGALLKAIVTFTDAQIKALPTTPLVLIPAPGIGKMIYAGSVYGSPDSLVRFNGVPYTNVDTNASAQFSLGPDGNGGYCAYNLQHMLDADWGGHAIAPAGVNAIQAAGGTVNDQASFENQPLFFALVNASLGNLTGGDPANTMDVLVYYRIVDLPS